MEWLKRLTPHTCVIITTIGLINKEKLIIIGGTLLLISTCILMSNKTKKELM